MTDRSLTVTWQDPAELAGQARSGTGLEFLQSIIEGQLPKAPIQELLGFEIEEAEEGRVVFSLDPGEQHYNPIGSVHGGVVATLLDSAMGAAVHSTLPQGSGYVTLEVKFNLVRAITADSGRVLAEGKMIHAGKTVATVEATLRTADGGKLLRARHLDLLGALGRRKALDARTLLRAQSAQGLEHRRDRLRDHQRRAVGHAARGSRPVSRCDTG